MILYWKEYFALIIMNLFIFTLALNALNRCLFTKGIKFKGFYSAFESIAYSAPFH